MRPRKASPKKTLFSFGGLMILFVVMPRRRIITEWKELKDGN
jgi:hypothetical protein